MASRQNHSILSIALCVSVLAHALVLLVLSQRGPGTNSTTYSDAVSPLRIEIVAPLEETTTTKAAPPKAATAPPPSESDTHPSASRPDGPSPVSTTWVPAEASVKTFPELPLPSDTASATGFVELEIELDDKGKPITVTVKKESPSGFFAEWGWAMGMQGSYTPKVTTHGPAPSTIRVRLDIAGGTISAP